ASLMRMQARRVQGEEARRVLEESVQRITSVAVVHEFLSHSASQETISLQEVARRIIGQIRDSLLDPSRHIELRMSTGETIWLPAESATRCALVINELVQNAIEHGMADREEGQVTIELQDDGNIVTIVVTDNGVGLPEGFDLQTNANLGLQIVKSMVERDLRGSFALTTENGMTRATVRFVKLL
ncbi:MAG: sensor histidine kinase, partial [Chloroflexi bacterium]|nr:sensor histidine kinase [Chloroflexota bacterium]